jgi:hypothetical protein
MMIDVEIWTFFFLALSCLCDYYYYCLLQFLDVNVIVKEILKIL